MQKCYDAIKSRESVIVSDNEFQIRATIIENLINEVKLHNIPFKVSDTEILNRLAKYGNVRDIVWQKLKVDDNTEIYASSILR